MSAGRFRIAAMLTASVLWCAFPVSMAIAQATRPVSRQTAGQAAKTSNSKSVPAGMASGESAPVLSDEALERAIAQRFAKSAIAPNGFAVSVSGGVATLRGTAQVAQHKGVATRLARAAGAKHVRNQIELSPSAREAMQRLGRGKAMRAKPPDAPSGKSAKPAGGRPPAKSGRKNAAPPQDPRNGNVATLTGNVQDSVTKRPNVASKERAAQPVKRFSTLQPRSGERSEDSAQRRERSRRY